MSNLYAPFRYDYVGSFLRPAELKKARADYEAGAITADQLKAVEDQCITELVAKQKAAGYHVITDGEFRRATWHLDFMWGFDGVGHKKTNTGLPFHGEAAMIDDTFVTGRIGLSGEHPFVDHFFNSRKKIPAIIGDSSTSISFQNHTMISQIHHRLQ